MMNTTKDLLKLFNYKNGSEHVEHAEHSFAVMAADVATRGLRDVEIENALRKLVEAKDAFIRAVMAGRAQDD